MAETLLQFQHPVVGPDSTHYRARACGAETAGGTWEAWIEFDPLTGITLAPTIRSPRETIQHSRNGAEYWASGLTAVYLEGALTRALHPAGPPRPDVFEKPAFDGPAR